MICRVSSDCPLRNFNYVQIVIEIAGKRFFFFHMEMFGRLFYLFIYFLIKIFRSMRMGGRRETHPPLLNRVRTLPSEHCLAEVIFHPQRAFVERSKSNFHGFFLNRSLQS